MAGTLVRDALAANLLAGATLNAAGTTNGTAVNIAKCGPVRVELDTATVTGTSPTIQVTIQAADDTGFTAGVVTLGAFPVSTGTTAAQSDSIAWIDVRCDKNFIRTNVVIAGTSPVYTGSTVTLRQKDDRRTPATDTATIS